MHTLWIWLVLLYGVFKGLREICKKKALQVSPTIEVLFVYSLITFLFLIPDIPNVWGMEPKYYIFVAIKSLVIFIAWMCGFKAIKHLPISLYGVLDLSQVGFAITFGVVILGESMSVFQMIGFVLVCAGLLLLKWWPFSKEKAAGGAPGEPVKPKFVILAILCCLFNAVSGLMDKLLMSRISDSQLQFWYMLFLVLLYLGYYLVSRIPVGGRLLGEKIGNTSKLSLRRAFSNKWIWILAILFVIADRALFIANGMAESRLTVMTLLKKIGVIVTIAAGRFIFKEKDILHKLICAIIILTGIFLGTL